uniref:Uncharacterized protein LOC8270369 n=1 Tax=Rhizophora mucronata TaxID=61149 RepID=A0A2P2LKU0_RHIMU
MGESMVTASMHEDKMGERAASNPVLQVSVSFGRFENDSLSWEKWSSFSPNKYLEEVEKYATPGSVAQKKAYFEAHYQKIAARKAAELLDQEKQMDYDSLRSDEHDRTDAVGKTCARESTTDMSNGQTSGENVLKETELNVEFDIADADECNHYNEINIESQDDSTEAVKEEKDSNIDIPKSNCLEESISVKEEETTNLGPQDVKKLPKNLKKEMEKIPKQKEENKKLDNRKESQESKPTRNVRDVARVKKKLQSPPTKSAQASTLKVSKPVPPSSALSRSQSSTKKAIKSSTTKSKVPSAGESKKVAPKSLHMSLRLDSPSSGPASLTTTRKPLIMEKMGDKDIVKRAFKTFQNNFNQPKSSPQEISLKPKQVAPKGTEAKVSTSLTPRKENGGFVKAGGLDKRNAKEAPSFVLTSDERTDKRQEFPKKLSERPNAKVAESTCLRAKSKVGSKTLRI